MGEKGGKRERGMEEEMRNKRERTSVVFGQDHNTRMGSRSLIQSCWRGEGRDLNLLSYIHCASLYTSCLHRTSLLLHYTHTIFNHHFSLSLSLFRSLFFTFFHRYLPFSSSSYFPSPHFPLPHLLFRVFPVPHYTHTIFIHHFLLSLFHFPSLSPFNLFLILPFLSSSSSFSCFSCASLYTHTIFTGPHYRHKPEVNQHHMKDRNATTLFAQAYKHTYTNSALFPPLLTILRCQLRYSVKTCQINVGLLAQAPTVYI